MDQLPIFSSYSQGENRVSSSILAVFGRIDLRLLEGLLLRIAGGDPIELVTIRPQYRKKGEGDSVPDGAIIASAQVLFEFKLHDEELNERQLLGHCKHFHRPDAHPCWLVVITPDAAQPELIDKVNSKVNLTNSVYRTKVRWCSYATLSDGIDEVLEQGAEEIANRDRFLLRELQILVANEGLVAVDQTVIVAARVAWSEYEKHHMYVCQANRSFRAATHLGFYTAGRIKESVPMILQWYDIEVGSEGRVSIVSDGDAAGGAMDRLKSLCADGGRAIGFYRAADLTPPEDERTIDLGHDVANDQRDKNGRTVAWTMGQRYVPTDRLKVNPAPCATSELLT